MSTNMDDQRGQVIEQTDSTSRSEVASQSSLHGPASEPPDFGSRPPNNLRQSVELHIEELVLDGFGPDDRYLIGEAVELELSRLFAERGAPPTITRDGEIAEMDAAAFETEPGSNADAVGAKVARAIYGGLSR